jgi:squalene synthase HpnC
MTAAASQAPSPSTGANYDLPPDYLVLGRAGAENFPVASRLLPASVRADLMALYGWARLVDQLGDDYAGDRLAALNEVERQLRSALADGPSSAGPEDLHPLVVAIAATVKRRQISPGPLFDLVQANRQDQTTSRYETFTDLVGYCHLSADPVGRMVLAIFGALTPERVAWSDGICTALQLVEHWQDVAEDAIVGRIYIPQEDLRRFGVTEDELVPPPGGYPGRRSPVGWGASTALRSLVAFECGRARHMLEEGGPLVASLPGRLRVAVAGFIAGGQAAIDALAALDYDPLADPARPTTGRFASHLARTLAGVYLGGHTSKHGAAGATA